MEQAAVVRDATHKPMLYFDHNASSPLDTRVLEAMEPYLTTMYGNPSSTHRLGRVSRTALDIAREQVAQLVNVTSSQVVFTSGGTEANNLALMMAKKTPGSHLLYGTTEHPSVVSPMNNFSAQGYAVEALAVNQQGIISRGELTARLRSDTTIVSMMHANNETGVIQNIAELSELIKPTDAVLHVDAVQSAAKIPVNFNALGADLMTLSAHKMYGPKGAGALIAAKPFDLEPMLSGGGQEWGRRAGTENVAAIVGFGKAAELAMQELGQREQQLLSLKNTLETRLKTINGLTIVAGGTNRLPNTTQVTINGMDGELILMMLDKKGICISGGSACSSRILAPSPVLTAMGYCSEDALSAIRISLGQRNTEGEVIQLFEALRGVVATYAA